MSGKYLSVTNVLHILPFSYSEKTQKHKLFPKIIDFQLIQIATN